MEVSGRRERTYVVHTALKSEEQEERMEGNEGEGSINRMKKEKKKGQLRPPRGPSDRRRQFPVVIATTINLGPDIGPIYSANALDDDDDDGEGV